MFTTIYVYNCEYLYFRIMIRDLKNLYTLVIDNKVVMFETNLKKFVDELNEIEPETRNYDYYYRKFKKINQITFENTKGVKHYIQKVY